MRAPHVRAAEYLESCCICPWSLTAAAAVSCRIFLASQGFVRRPLIQFPISLNFPLCPYTSLPILEGIWLWTLDPQGAWHTAAQPWPAKGCWQVRSLVLDAHGQVPGGQPCPLQAHDMVLHFWYNGLNCASPKFICQSPNPQSLKVTLSRNRVFTEVMKLKWSH